MAGLMDVPGLRGYLQAQQIGQQQQTGQLQQMGALQQIMQRQQQAQEQQEAKALLMKIGQQAGGDPAKMLPMLMQAGPLGIKLAEGLKGLVPAPAKPQLVNTVAADGTTPIQRFVNPNVGDVYPTPPKEQKPEAPHTRAIQRGDKKVYQEFDPQTRTWADVPGASGPAFARQVPPVITVGNNAPAQGDFSKIGDDYLNTIPVNIRSLVKGVGNYEINPMTFAARLGNREKMLEMVRQYNPDYDDTQYANKRRAIAQFGSGPQGNTVRSLNVAIEHIDTLQRAADAMKNGQFTPGNKVYNEVAKLFGVTPPNTFEGMRDIVANEVVKGTIGNAGALTDRQEAAAKIKAAASPEQLKELMTGWTELMGGQVKGLEQQYAGASGLKDFRTRYLTERARNAISLAESKAGGGSQVREFATEAEAIASGVKGKVRIGGRNATIE